MIRVLLYDPSSQQLSKGGVELIDVWASNPAALLWADLQDEPEETERDLLVQRFGVHPLAIQDGQRTRHPPKLERFDDHTFILLKGLDAETDSVEFGTIQIAMFLGGRFLVTRHNAASSSIAHLWSMVGQDAKVLAAGPDSVALRIARRVFERYLAILLNLEPRLEAIEDEMRSNPRDELLNELTGYVTDLKKLKRVSTYHLQVFASLRSGQSPGISEERDHEINDIFEQAERNASLSGLFHEVASELIDSYISVASHHLNQIMKVLTIITAIFVPLGFLAGIYGMNFEYMPELKAQWGYYGLLGMMIFIALSLLYLFKRKHWL